MLNTEDMSLKCNSPKSHRALSFFGDGEWLDDKKCNFPNSHELCPSFKLHLDKEVYRPGDFVTATVEISNPRISKDTYEANPRSNEACSLLVDNLSIEVKGVEKLDNQWFSIPNPLPGSKQKRGETMFLDCTAPATVSKVIVSCGHTKTYMIRVQLPMILPPSYRGTSIRYFYYVRSTVSLRWLALENGHHDMQPENDLIKMEARAPLQVWPTQKDNNFLNEEGNVLTPKELDCSSSSLYPHQRKPSSSFDSSEDLASTFASRSIDSLSSEGLLRGRSFNIRMDDQILLRFSPKNLDSTYCFGDMIGGTLTFFHGEGPRRCLEVSITLETSEVINQKYVHPSRRNSPTITKVQNDHHEVVADLAQTSFIFSIPLDGPMSFATPNISVQWSLRFEFFTTPAHIDLSRYEHPLLVEQREKGDWVLPITVNAPSLRAEAPPHARHEKASSAGSWFSS